MADAQASLLDQVRSGANRQLQVLAASGFLPLAPEDLIPLQVQFARGQDPELAGKASEALRQVDVRVAAPFLERQAGEDVLAFFALQTSHPRLIETILRRRDVPRQLLVDLARRLPPDLQEILILRQDAILEEPEILSALEANPQLSGYVQRRITEYREHLLPRERTASGVRRPSRAVEEIDDDALAAALAAVKALPGRGRDRGEDRPLRGPDPHAAGAGPAQAGARRAADAAQHPAARHEPAGGLRGAPLQQPVGPGDRADRVQPLGAAGGAGRRSPRSASGSAATP